jgi:hypothetical protein
MLYFGRIEGSFGQVLRTAEQRQSGRADPPERNRDEHLAARTRGPPGPFACVPVLPRPPRARPRMISTAYTADRSQLVAVPGSVTRLRCVSPISAASRRRRRPLVCSRPSRTDKTAAVDLSHASSTTSPLLPCVCRLTKKDKHPCMILFQFSKEFSRQNSYHRNTTNLRRAFRVRITIDRLPSTAERCRHGSVKLHGGIPPMEKLVVDGVSSPLSGRRSVSGHTGRARRLKQATLHLRIGRILPFFPPSSTRLVHARLPSFVRKKARLHARQKKIHLPASVRCTIA